MLMIYSLKKFYKVIMSEEIKIAGDLTIEGWYKTREKLKPLYNDNWEKAYEYFYQRIEFRYLKPIRAILGLTDKKGEGFTIVNLQCSLIETIECFVNGWLYKYPYFVDLNGVSFKGNEKVFRSFFNNRIIIGINGKDFYNSVRCSLLHETQTKNNWKIKTNIDNRKIYEEKEGFKILYRDGFQYEIEEVLKRYKIAITEGKSFDGISVCDLRRNFIAKMNHICKES